MLETVLGSVETLFLNTFQVGIELALLQQMESNTGSQTPQNSSGLNLGNEFMQLCEFAGTRVGSLVSIIGLGSDHEKRLSGIKKKVSDSINSGRSQNNTISIKTETNYNSGNTRAESGLAAFRLKTGYFNPDTAASINSVLSAFSNGDVASLTPEFLEKYTTSSALSSGSIFDPKKDTSLDATESLGSEASQSFKPHSVVQPNKEQKASSRLSNAAPKVSLSGIAASNDITVPEIASFPLVPVMSGNETGSGINVIYSSTQNPGSLFQPHANASGFTDINQSNVSSATQQSQNETVNSNMSLRDIRNFWSTVAAKSNWAAEASGPNELDPMYMGLKKEVGSLQNVLQQNASHFQPLSNFQPYPHDRQYPMNAMTNTQSLQSSPDSNISSGSNISAHSNQLQNDMGAAPPVSGISNSNTVNTFPNQSSSASHISNGGFQPFQGNDMLDHANDMMSFPSNYNNALGVLTPSRQASDSLFQDSQIYDPQNFKNLHTGNININWEMYQQNMQSVQNQQQYQLIQNQYAQQQQHHYQQQPSHMFTQSNGPMFIFGSGCPSIPSSLPDISYMDVVRMGLMAGQTNLPSTSNTANASHLSGSSSPEDKAAYEQLQAEASAQAAKHLSNIIPAHRFITSPPESCAHAASMFSAYKSPYSLVNRSDLQDAARQYLECCDGDLYNSTSPALQQPINPIYNEFSERFFRHSLMRVLQCYVNNNYTELNRFFHGDFADNEHFFITRSIAGLRMGVSVKKSMWHGKVAEDEQYPGFWGPIKIEQVIEEEKRKAEESSNKQGQDSISIEIDLPLLMDNLANVSSCLGTLPRVRVIDATREIKRALGLRVDL